MTNSTKRKYFESFRLCILLALSGGLMDAYSYICRGGVFANAQTGNILLLGISIFKHNIYGITQYFFPIIAFASGIIISNILKMRYKSETALHWSKLSLLSEALILFFVSFLPQECNLLANSLTSFACGIQVESFKKLHGNTIATTMCIGNLKNGTNYLVDFFYTKNINSIKMSIIYYGIIIFFTIGAIIGNAFIELYNEKAIIASSLLLLFGFFVLTIIQINDSKKENK